MIDDTRSFYCICSSSVCLWKDTLNDRISPVPNHDSKDSSSPQWITALHTRPRLVHCLQKHFWHHVVILWSHSTGPQHALWAHPVQFVWTLRGIIQWLPKWLAELFKDEIDKLIEEIDDVEKWHKLDFAHHLNVNLLTCISCGFHSEDEPTSCAFSFEKSGASH